MTTNTNVIESLIAAAMAEGAAQQDIPSYWQLSNAMARLGFTGHMYIDGDFVVATAGQPDALANLMVHKPPITLFWTRDDGQQVIQCAKDNGDSQLFWTMAGADIQSQLSYLSQRFESPTILGGQTLGEGATGQLLGDAATAAGV